MLIERTYINVILFFVITTFVCVLNSSAILASVSDNKDLCTFFKKIDNKILKKINSKEIPGLGIVITKGHKIIFSKCYGYANVNKKIPVTNKTFFELGSNSKAFTGLCILKLLNEQKIKKDVDISEYLPWFKVNYDNKPTQLTVKNLLYHTSGIPFSSINQLLQGSDKDLLCKSIKKISNSDLERKPSTDFKYATVNYDILGLLIETVTGLYYPEYVRKEILNPLKLDNIFLSREKAKENGILATGYKVFFTRPIAFNAPFYYSNLPAGYFIGNIKSISKWLMLQYGSGSTSFYFRKLIIQSHIPGSSFRVNNHPASYGAGWFIQKINNKEVFIHKGENPNYSSFLGVVKNEKIGVGILTNINSNFAAGLGGEIIKYFSRDKDCPGELTENDFMREIGKWELVGLVITCSAGVILFFFIMVNIFDIIKGIRAFTSKNILIGGLVNCTVFIIFLILANANKLFFNGMTWSNLLIWLPGGTQLLILSITLFMIFIFILINLRIFFQLNTKF
jgi:putative pyoverdin transport system ATP-binding/permease protein